MENFFEMEVEDELEILEDGNSDEAIEPKSIDQNGENQDEESEKKVKPKKIIRNPRYNLNVELLKGPKGLTALEQYFDRVEFKGKGHEEEDLKVLLKTYEHWSHRLYPKFPFTDCIERIEKLSTKRPLQTYLTKIRSGLIDDELPLSENLPNDNSDEEEGTQTDLCPQISTLNIAQDLSMELTEEQLELIRINREKAENLRLERLRKIQEKATSYILENSRKIMVSTSNSSQSDENIVSSTSDSIQINSIMLLPNIVSNILKTESFKHVLSCNGGTSSSTTSQDNGIESNDNKIMEESRKRNKKFCNSDTEEYISEPREIECCVNNQGDKQVESRNQQGKIMTLPNTEHEKEIGCNSQEIEN